MQTEHPLLLKLARGLDLSEDEAAAIRNVQVQLVTFRADEMIVHEGDRPSRSFLVVEA